MVASVAVIGGKPLLLLKGYNMGPRSQVLSWDFISFYFTQAAQDDLRRKRYQTLDSSGFRVRVKDPEQAEA